MSTSSKENINKTCVRPIKDSRADTTETKKALRVSEIKSFKSIVEKTLRARVWIAKVKKVCEVINIVRGEDNEENYCMHMWYCTPSQRKTAPRQMTLHQRGGGNRLRRSIIAP